MHDSDPASYTDQASVVQRSYYAPGRNICGVVQAIASTRCFVIPARLAFGDCSPRMASLVIMQNLDQRGIHADIVVAYARAGCEGGG